MTSYKTLLLLGLSQTFHWVPTVAKNLKVNHVLIEKKIFADKEILVEIPVSVRDKNVFLCQSTSTPANENIMELLIAIDSLKRASAYDISLVVPYFGYARQDRKSKGREPITAKLIANLINSFGVRRILTFDLHAPQIQGFFDIAIDHLTLLPQILTQFLTTHKLTGFVLVAPDHGSLPRVKRINNFLQTEMAVLSKTRPSPNKAEIEFILGDVANKDVVLVDDMIDTANTLISSLQFLKKQGAKKLYVVATHPVFSNNALEKLNQLFLKGLFQEIWVSNTIPVSQHQTYPFLKIYQIEKELKTIFRLILNRGSLFEYSIQQFNNLKAFHND